MDRAFAGGAGGIRRTGVGGSWKRVLPNKKTSPVGQYVRIGTVSHRPTFEDGKGQPTPQRRKRLHLGNVGDGPCKKGLMYLGSSQIRGSETLILKGRMPSIPSEQFLPTWRWLNGRVYHNSAPLRFTVVFFFVRGRKMFALSSCTRYMSCVDTPPQSTVPNNNNNPIW